MKAAEKQQRLDQFLAAHRARGLPVTTQRRAVFEAMLERKDHPTADQVYRAVRLGLPQISRMTAHRILNAFVSLGLVARTCHPGSAARYDPKIEPHHHLVCLDCGKIIDIEDLRLNRIPWPKVDPGQFTIQECHVHFRGHCARCQPKAGRSRRGPKADRAESLRSGIKNLE